MAVEFFAVIGILLMFVITIVIVFVVNMDLMNRTIDLEERVSDLEKKRFRSRHAGGPE